VASVATTTNNNTDGTSASVACICGISEPVMTEDDSGA